MQVVTYKEWCDLKKMEDRSREAIANDLIVKQCKCGDFYSYPNWKMDPKACAVCRDDEGTLVR